MRALLVDWMVEVQESFELNHETLYLAVKLVDLFLTRSTQKQPEKDYLTKEELQLLGASALFIASKFDVSNLHCYTFYFNACYSVLCDHLTEIFQCIRDSEVRKSQSNEENKESLMCEFYVSLLTIFIPILNFANKVHIDFFRSGICLLY